MDAVEQMYKNAVGKYVVFDLESTRYGYQTKDITVLDQATTRLGKLLDNASGSYEQQNVD